MNPSADWISLDSGSPGVLQTHFPRRREPTWLSIKFEGKKPLRILQWGGRS